MKPIVLACCLAILVAPALAPAADPTRFELKDGDRVAFIGNTFVEREQVDCFIETALTIRYPDRNITFRNLGYSGDTVTGEARGLCMGWSQFEGADKAFERLRKLVAEFKPTVLLVNYGMTESFFGKDKLAEFTANFNKMLDALGEAAGTSPRIVLMSPNFHEDLGRPLPDPAEHNKNLELYSDAIKEIAAKRGGVFIDLFAITKDARGRGTKLTWNGIHLTPFGYWYVAHAIAIGNSTGGISEFSGQATVDVLKDDTRQYHVNENRLPEPPEPGELPGQSLKLSFLEGGRSIDGLAPGSYQLKAGDEVLGTGTAEQWKAGAVVLKARPDLAQVEALRKLIVAKNFDYFNYQRPDNDSYILAFRKREQGRNAVEIPQFLPLVEEKEKQIAELRMPKALTFTLEKVK